MYLLYKNEIQVSAVKEYVNHLWLLYYKAQSLIPMMASCCSSSQARCISAFQEPQTVLILLGHKENVREKKSP